MKKTLSVLAVLGIAAVIGTHSANAFEWSSLNGQARRFSFDWLDAFRVASHHGMHLLRGNL